ncbi:hypothetical protein FOZ62_026938 [Perkinsus olseni]|uniref:Uncharacterized protein n=1 Tax=Perkinsus olseni TaxID=32597 RepID=A0A7J6QHG8_PEROL|nr:hypothetical protein FOZ62_026938 [Perkinsus olseni]
MRIACFLMTGDRAQSLISEWSPFQERSSASSLRYCWWLIQNSLWVYRSSLFTSCRSSDRGDVICQSFQFGCAHAAIWSAMNNIAFRCVDVLSVFACQSWFMWSGSQHVTFLPVRFLLGARLNFGDDEGGRIHRTLWYPSVGSKIYFGNTSENKHEMLTHCTICVRNNKAINTRHPTSIFEKKD